jgi:hypothetical protein
MSLFVDYFLFPFSIFKRRRQIRAPNSWVRISAHLQILICFVIVDFFFLIFVQD